MKVISFSTNIPLYLLWYSINDYTGRFCIARKYFHNISSMKTLANFAVQ